MTSFLKEVLLISNNGDLKILSYKCPWDIKNIEVEYLGEYIFEDVDILESDIYLKKRNSQYIQFSLLVPVVANMNIYKNINSKNIKSVEDFFKFYTQIIVDSVIFVYNSRNPKSYLFKYKSVGLGVSNNIYKKYIYRVRFEIFGKEECIYFNIKKSQFIS
ncbi:MAG: hypothetical protein U9R39_00675 [Campylobacterota bacterium]|nr:hypothetical protein [Campylobacterota bacterium]